MPKHQESPQVIAYEYLREGIVSGAFPAGDWLKSAMIADRLGISRMPVREALRQLHAEGLVTLRPNRGAVVTNLTADDVLELFEMRAALEVLATQHAATRATGGDIIALEADLEALAAMKSTPLLWLEYHDRFHDNLCRLSGRRRLCEHIRLIRSQIFPYTRLYARHNEDPELVGYEHETILDAVRSGSAEEIDRVVRTHVMKNAVSIIEVLQRILPDSEMAEGRKGRTGEPDVERLACPAGEACDPG